MTPDLHKRLLHPPLAREFIDKFDWSPLDKPKYIVLGGGREVNLDSKKLSDEDAVATALALLIDIEIPMAMRTAKYERYEQ